MKVWMWWGRCGVRCDNLFSVFMFWSIALQQRDRHHDAIMAILRAYRRVFRRDNTNTALSSCFYVWFARHCLSRVNHASQAGTSKYS